MGVGLMGVGLTGVGLTGVGLVGEIEQIRGINDVMFRL